MTKDNISMQKGISFLKLIENNKILIPKIQRDYAQGRLDLKASEIRDGFLTSIFDTLVTVNTDPLLLDFIYGSTHDNIFTPLDGQQRLTTLFLFHWYFLPKDKKSPLYVKNGNSCYSKFYYETRITSKDFCNALTTYYCEDFRLILQKNNMSSKTKKQLSDIIKNQSWFLWSWRKDPTIKAMLVMLDEIDKRATLLENEKQSGIWEQLQSMKIIFNLLPLEQFALTDELYVKMNARGKELSQFDIFKSSLEEQMRLNNISEEIQNQWRNNIDSNWIDLFWNNLAKPKLTQTADSKEALTFVNSVEKGYLRFFKRMMLFHLFVNANTVILNINEEGIKQYIPFDFDETNFINKLRDFSVRNDMLLLMPLFTKTKFFNDDFFRLIINFFNSFIYQTDSVKHNGTELIYGVGFEIKKTLFEAFISDKIDYETRVQFYAVIKFFEYNAASDVNENEELKNEFNSWMRIIRNLSTNTNSYFYNGYDDFMKSLKSIEIWAKEVYAEKTYFSINEYLYKKDGIDGFNGEQLKEEKRKAELISKSSDWFNSIRKAEEHPYFLGQIRFLIDWSYNNDNYDLEKFDEYFEKISSVFSVNGLKDELCKTHIFRNAMLTTSGWYLIGSSLIQNTTKSRDWSWKRYLRESDKAINIKTLLDRWDRSQNFCDFCSNQIIINKPKDWRRYFIEIPVLYNEMKDDRIAWWNWENKEICLLSKTRWSQKPTNWNPKHKELFTYFLYLKYKNQDDIYLDSENENHPFSTVFNSPDGCEFSIKFVPIWENENKKGKYIISSVFNPNLDLFVYNIDNGRWEQYFDSKCRDEVEKIIVDLVNLRKLNSN